MEDQKAARMGVRLEGWMVDQKEARLEDRMEVLMEVLMVDQKEGRLGAQMVVLKESCHLVLILLLLPQNLEVLLKFLLQTL